MSRNPDLDELVIHHTRKDFVLLKQDMTVQAALDFIRTRGVGEKIIYFYVADEQQRLVGVLPTRRLLTLPLETRLADIMITRVITIPDTATVMDACEFFAMHKLFAFPVVDKEQRVVGLVDVGLFTDEMFDVAEREQMDEVF